MRGLSKNNRNEEMAELVKESPYSNPSATQLSEETGIPQSTISKWLEPFRPFWEGSIFDPRKEDCINFNRVSLDSMRSMRHKYSQERKDFDEEELEEILTEDKCYLYFMECNSLHKIGVSDSPYSRAEYFQTGCPYKIEVVKTVPYESSTRAKEKENELHQYLEHWNVRGEWFDVRTETVEKILSEK